MGWTTTLVVTSNVFTLQRGSVEPEYRARLMHTARILSTIDHPGVEHFVALEDDGRRTTLVTGFAGGRSLATDAPHRARDIAALGAAILRTIDDLHANGVTHGPVSRAGIRFAVGFVPVLCNFDRGRLHAPDDGQSWRRDRVTDVQSVGLLLAGLLADGRALAPRHPFERIDRLRLAHLCRQVAEGGLTDATALSAGLERISPRR